MAGFGCLCSLARSLASVAREQWQCLVLNGSVGAPCFAVRISHFVRQKRAVTGAVPGQDCKDCTILGEVDYHFTLQNLNRECFLSCFPKETV